MAEQTVIISLYGINQLVFRGVRKTEKRAISFVMSVCLPLCAHGKTPNTLDEFS